MAGRPKAATVDKYIAAFAPNVRLVLKKVRAMIRRVVPRAGEKISYGIPAFTLDGNLIYFAAFKSHIGLYPPVRGDEKLQRAIARYRGEKGNLKFPLDEPIPYGLIARVVRQRVREHEQRARAGRKGPSR